MGHGKVYVFRPFRYTRVCHIGNDMADHIHYGFQKVCANHLVITFCSQFWAVWKTTDSGPHQEAKTKNQSTFFPKLMTLESNLWHLVTKPGSFDPSAAWPNLPPTGMPNQNGQFEWNSDVHYSPRTALITYWKKVKQEERPRFIDLGSVRPSVTFKTTII